MVLSITPEYGYRIRTNWNQDLSSDATYNVEVLEPSSPDTNWLTNLRYYQVSAVDTYDELLVPTVGNTAFFENATIRWVFAQPVNINAWIDFIDTYLKNATFLGKCSIRTLTDTETYEEWNVSPVEWTPISRGDTFTRNKTRFLNNASITWALVSVIT